MCTAGLVNQSVCILTHSRRSSCGNSPCWKCCASDRSQRF